MWVNSSGYSEFFVFLVSLFFFLVYFIILILPCTRFKKKVPERKSFYFYILFLSVSYLFNIVGGIFNLFCLSAGIWFELDPEPWREMGAGSVGEFFFSFSFYGGRLIIRFVHPPIRPHSLNQFGFFLYFAFFAPVLYIAFLKPWFQKNIWNNYVMEYVNGAETVEPELEAPEEIVAVSEKDAAFGYDNDLVNNFDVEHDDK